MLSLKAKNQHFLTKSKVNLEFEHSVLRAIDCPLKLLSSVELVFDRAVKLVHIEIISL